MIRFSTPHPSEITPQSLWTGRRAFLKQAGLLGLGSTAMARGASADSGLKARSNPDYRVEDPLTPMDKVTQYNNFYEFGTGKDDPAQQATRLKTRPWTLTVGGEVNKPKVFDLDDLLKLAPLEERIYRLRCVEAWSMVIPWIGVPLSTLIQAVEPRGNAKFLELDRKSVV